ncbi:MAG: hypothetical protein OEM04_04310 [Flavobacteriaceae bacterium]|nr:hypothetical protein [Flavobacteriaceae bacterium]
MVINENKIRNEFFISALFVENNITAYISDKLHIENPVDSTLLGNGKSAIHFDQKIQLLLESDKLNVIDKSKLSAFREIHKELSKNKNKALLEESFTSADHNDDFLLILYPQSDYLPREEKLTNACYQLIGEVSDIVANFTKKTAVKIDNKKNKFKIDRFLFGKFAFLFSIFFQ